MKNLKIEICSLRKCNLKFAYDVRVDRASVLGNPFPMRSETERDLVCDEYDKYFNNILLQINGLFMDGSPDLAGITAFKDAAFLERFDKTLNSLLDKALKYNQLRLFCWCAPKRCHAETIAKYVADKLSEFFDNYEIKYII